MNSEWVPFTDLLSAIIDNRGRTCPVGDTGMPLIATNCVDRSNLYPSYDTSRFVSDETYRTWFRGHPKPGDILFVCKGSPGRTNWVPDPVDFCIAQDMVAVRADPKMVYPKYLFAALRSPAVQSQIDNMHVGTMIPHFKKGDFGKLNIPLPNREAQEFIGDSYFTISQRINFCAKPTPRSKPSRRRCSNRGLSISTPFAPNRRAALRKGWTKPPPRCFPTVSRNRRWGWCRRGGRLGRFRTWQTSTRNHGRQKSIPQRLPTLTWRMPRTTKLQPSVSIRSMKRQVVRGGCCVMVIRLSAQYDRVTDLSHSFMRPRRI